MSQFIIGFLLAQLVAYLAYRAHSLNKSGAISAAFSGAIIFGIGGWQWATLLLTFFITSSWLSRAFNKNKQALNEKYSKGHERDAGQVLGNGGLATIFAAVHLFLPNETWPWLGFAASLAAVNADTWATELGVLNPHPPRIITNLRKVVEKGTSGAISLIGTLAAFAGAVLIGILAALLGPQTASFSTCLLVTIAGFSGALFDSFLGATLQAIYYCPKDKKETEQHPLHSCGTPTSKIHGWGWLDNDWVNFACSASGIVTYLLINGLFYYATHI
jgi:uncharacterized protein (TIGR00297 family)